MELEKMTDLYLKSEKQIYNNQCDYRTSLFKNNMKDIKERKKQNKEKI